MCFCFVKLTRFDSPFLVESVIALVAIGALFLGFRYSTSISNETKTSPIPLGKSDGRNFDIFGSIVLLIAVVTPLAALNLGGSTLPWNHPVIIFMLSITPLLFAGFAYLEIVVVKFPLLPLHILKSAPILKALLCTGLIIFARNQVGHFLFWCKISVLY